VSPDMLPKGSIEITACQINGVEYTNYDPKGLSITLPESDERLRVKVTVTPK